MESELKLEGSKNQAFFATNERTGKTLRIKDLEGELTGFRGILTRLHALVLYPLGVRTHQTKLPPTL